MTTLPPRFRPATTLLQVTLLHLWTHVYHVALLPLYLPLARDLGLGGVDQATLLVSLLMGAYFLPSYAMGLLADRWGRKPMLVWGLLVNATGFIALSRSHSLGTAAASVILAGLGGSSFHPAATALVARLYPTAPGRAFGWFGIGASLGFFLGPLYSGWRAASVGWRQTLLEMGVGGVVTALGFAWRAVEPPAAPVRPGTPDRKAQLRLPWGWLLVMAMAFALRDFAGAGNGTLSSLYLQTVHGDSIQSAGGVLSLVFLASAVSNPLVGHWSENSRLRWVASLLPIAAGCLVALAWVPRAAFPATLMTFGFFFMSTYPIIEAALMESVPDAVRGRVFGLFITVGGLVGNLSHWLIGRWVESLGNRASEAASFRSMFGALALGILIPLAVLPLFRRLREWGASVADETSS
jgi:FSR family fosmidomycin resistance protein-like MFS transporter